MLSAWFSSSGRRNKCANILDADVDGGRENICYDAPFE
jgi:hypothetical protein